MGKKLRVKKSKRRLHWCDKRVQRVLKHLYGTFCTKSLERKIARTFDCKKHPSLAEVAQEICDIHCSGQGYSPDDVLDQLDRVLPAQ
jgi:hypothetical protein